MKELLRFIFRMISILKRVQHQNSVAEVRSMARSTEVQIVFGKARVEASLNVKYIAVDEAKEVERIIVEAVDSMKELMHMQEAHT